MLQRELHHLMRLHRQIMANSLDAGLFRSHDVFCVAKTGSCLIWGGPNLSEPGKQGMPLLRRENGFLIP